MTCLSKSVFVELQRLGVVTSSEDYSAMMGRGSSYARSLWCKGQPVSGDALFVLYVDMNNLLTEIADQAETVTALNNLKSQVWQELCARANGKLGVV